MTISHVHIANLVIFFSLPSYVINSESVQAMLRTNSPPFVLHFMICRTERLNRRRLHRFPNCVLDEQAERKHQRDSVLLLITFKVDYSALNKKS